MATVKFTANLKRFYPKLAPGEFEGNNVAEILEAVNQQYPGIKDYIVDEQGKLRQHVNIFIHNVMVTDKDSLTDQVKNEDEIYIMQALSGG